MKIHSGPYPFVIDALVDSGADMCVFKADLARHAGVLDIARGDPLPLTRIGGEMPGYVHVIEIEVCGRRLSCPVAFASLPDQVDNILGRAGFFEGSQIGFNERNRMLYFSFF